MISCKQILHVCGGMCEFPARNFCYRSLFEECFQRAFLFWFPECFLKGRITFFKNILEMLGNNLLEMFLITFLRCF